MLSSLLPAGVFQVPPASFLERSDDILAHHDGVGLQPVHPLIELLNGVPEGLLVLLVFLPLQGESVLNLLSAVAYLLRPALVEQQRLHDRFEVALQFVFHEAER